LLLLNEKKPGMTGLFSGEGEPRAHQAAPGVRKGWRLSAF
jgi:hypothetical protein